MQYVILSDSAEEQLRRLRSEREQRYQQARLAYQRDLNAYDEHLSALATAYGPAFRRLRIFRAARTWWEHRRLRKQGDPQPPEPEGPTLEEQKWQAGMEGEQRLRAELTSELPGSGWTLMKGYQNRRGEIDYLLIAPVGIMAFKCEHVAGTIICTKDRWVRQKYDRAGAPVTQVPIVDRHGRSPSQQVNESADHLTEFLSQKGAAPVISKAVILTQSDVRLSTVEAPTVEIIMLKDVLRTLWNVCRSAARSLDTERIVELVKEHHQQWHAHESAAPPSSQKVSRQ